MTQDKLIREYDDGTIVKKSGDTERILRGHGAKLTYPVTRVITPEGRVYEFDHFRFKTPVKALIWAELWYRTSGTRMIVDSDLVPVDVVSLGKPGVAAYMTVSHGSSVETISNKLDISSQTVKQYLTDFWKQRR